LGCKPANDVESTIALMQGLAHKPSALQDLKQGRPVEVDALFVAPLELARMLGVETPTLNLLTALIKLRVRSAIEKGSAS
jgi:2-dehydropantoate 2-reductase